MEQSASNTLDGSHATMISYVSQQQQQQQQQQQDQLERAQGSFNGGVKFPDWQAHKQQFNRDYSNNLHSLFSSDAIATSTQNDNNLAGAGEFSSASQQDHNQPQQAHKSNGGTHLKGPFELDQLQATATSVRSNKVQTFQNDRQQRFTATSGDHSSQETAAVAAAAMTSSSSQLANTATKINANSEPIIIVKPSSSLSVVGNESVADDEPDDDYDSDEPPSPSSSSSSSPSLSSDGLAAGNSTTSQAQASESQDDFSGMSGGGGDGDGATSGQEDKINEHSPRHTPTRSHADQQHSSSLSSIGQHHLRDDTTIKHNGGTSEQEPTFQAEVKSNNRTVSSDVSVVEQSAPPMSSKMAKNVNKQQQQQQQVFDGTSLSRLVVRPPLGQLIGNNELLVGPFKSEAEAPATITLAGVVYQKSGASSALIRASSSLLKTATTLVKPKHSSPAYYSSPPAVQQLNNGGQLSSELGATQALATDQIGGDLAAPQNNLLPLQQQASPIYLSPQRGLHQQQQQVASGRVVDNTQNTPLPLIDSSSAGGSNSNTALLSDQQASFMRFSPFLLSASSSAGAGIDTSGQFGLLARNVGEQMLSLSSSNSKPITSLTTTATTKSFANHLTGANKVVAPLANTLYSGTSNLLTLPAPQAQQQQQQQQQQVSSDLQLAGSGLIDGNSFKRLPGGTTIWTIGGAGSHGGTGGVKSLSAPSALAVALSSAGGGGGGGGGGQQLDTGEQSQMSESKLAQQAQQHQAGGSGSGGPIVIVQKSVKPVKYHLLRAYLKLRRLLRPFEATYVFPSESGVGSTGASVGGGTAGVGHITASILRRRLSRSAKALH